MKKIIMYTQPDCPPCEFAKHFLTELGFSYEAKDIKKDKQAQKELINKYGSYSTPTFVIEDTNVITGFQLEELKKILEIK